jgi:adenylate kinase family enzyme
MAFDARQTMFSHLDAVIQNEQEYLRQEDHIEYQIIFDGYTRFVVFLESFSKYKELKNYVDMSGREGKS